MSRTQLYLAGLLVVQVALILLLGSPFSATSAGYESRPLLPALAAITPTQVEILGADDASIRLVREDGVWQIGSLGGFPADGDKIDNLLTQLQDVRVRRPVVSSGRYHASFKLSEDENEARVRVWADGDGDPDVDLILGSSPNFRTSHARLADEDAVYEARGLSPYDIQPATSGWIEREFIDAEESLVSGLRLTNEAGSFELVKREDVWQVVSPEDRTEIRLDPEKIDALVQSVTSLRLSDAVGPIDDGAHGFAEPAAILVLRWIGAEAGIDTDAPMRETTLRVGGKLADNESERYITREGFDFTGSIWGSSVQRLLEEKLDELQGS